MNRTFLLVAVALSTTAPLRAQEPIHVERRLPWARQPTTNAALAARVHQAAVTYRSYAPIPRVAFYDMAYPSDSAELAAMHGHAILVLTAIVQDSAEIPVTRLYVRTAAAEHELPLVMSLPSPVDPGDTLIRRTLGRFRLDAVYLFPLVVRATPGELLLDFAANRQGFRLDRFSADLPASLAHLPGMAVRGTHRGTPPTVAVLAMMRREYPDLARFLVAR